MWALEPPTLFSPSCTHTRFFLEQLECTTAPGVSGVYGVGAVPQPAGAMRFYLQSTPIVFSFSGLECGAV